MSKFIISLKKLTWTSSSWSLVLSTLSSDDEFIPVDLVKVLNILLTKSFEKLHSLLNSMGSLASCAIPTVTLEEMQADMELCAGGGVSAGAKRTITLVVMRTDL